MFPLANTKTVAGLLGTGVTNGATVTANIDCMGFDHLSLDVVMGTSNTTSNNPSVLKLSESDDTVVTNFADITAFVGDGAGGFTIATASTGTANIYRFDVDLRARKRYLRLTISPTTTQETVYTGRLGRAEESADRSATLAGVANLVRG